MRYAAGMSGVKLVLAVIAGLALAWWAQALPAPAPLDAPPEAFSAMRARKDVAWIASEPHPVGSAAHATVRNRLVSRLAELGLGARLQHVTDVELARTHEHVQLDNIVARVAGHDPTLPPLLLMSHYDSVPRSPGAADDGAGVATMLEVARILRLQQPARDVLLVFSDGEEAGLLGSKAFFADDTAARSLGAFVNLDARGGAGPTYLFELGASSDGMLAAFAREAPRSTTSSFAAFVYDHMPNGTDFTTGKLRGVPGLNFAFIGDPRQYHTPIATVDALSMSTLQHMGDQTLTAVRVLSRAALPAHASPRAWADLFGHVVIVYPAWLGWILIAVAALLVGASYHHTPRAAGLASGSLYIVCLLAVAALLLSGNALFLAPPGREHFIGLVSSVERFEVAICLVILAAMLLVARFVGRRTELPAQVTWLGLLSLAVVVAAGAQAAAPRVTILLVWPLLPASLALFASKRAPWLVPVAAALGTGLVLDWGHEFYLGLGLFRPNLMAPLALLGSVCLYPLVAAVATSKHGGRVAGALLLVGCAVTLSIRFS